MTTTSVYKTPEGQRAVWALYDAALADWPVPCTTHTIPTRHGDTFVIASGPESAPPLVLLHGSGAAAVVWAPDVAVYSSLHRVYAVDLLGEVGKSAPTRFSWDGPACAEWFSDLLQGLGLSRAALLGISLGGWIALRHATAHPEQVERLVLLCPAGVTPLRASFLPRILPLLLLGTWGFRRMNRLLAGRQDLPQGWDDVAVTIFKHFKPRMEALPIFSDAELRRLTMPTLLIGGGRDIVYDNRRTAARLSALLPDLQTTILPDAGHELFETYAIAAPFLAPAHS